jgi:hypothetical protein
MNELREWVQLVFIVIGGLLALFAYFQNLRQRRVENALKFISLFKDGLKEDDLSHWDSLFRSASELAGCPIGEYRNEDGSCSSIGDYFSEGSGDGYAISRMAESLDVVCHQVVTGVADAQTIYYELGQLINNFHLWLTHIPSGGVGESLMSTSFPSIGKFIKKYGKKSSKWPFRIFAYIE